MEFQRKTNTLRLLAALAAPLAHFSGSGWLLTGLTALAVLPLVWVPKRWDTMDRPLTVAQLLWLGYVAGSLLLSASAYWPSDNDLVVPMTILFLAAVTKEKAAPGIGAVLAVCMVLLTIPTAVSAAAKLEWEWLRPTIGPLPWAVTLILLLPNLPAADHRGKGGTAIRVGLMAVCLSAFVQGNISAQVAASVPDPYYQTARTLGHMEPVTAAAVTLGWYALTAYLLSAGRVLAKESGIDAKWAAVLVLGTAAAVILPGVQLPQPYPVLLSTFFWVLVPFLHKNKKVEKT